MDSLLTMFNATVAATLAAALGAIVLHPRVREGLVMRCGLVLMALGFAAMAVALVDSTPDLVSLGRAVALIHAGLVTALAGFLWSFKRKGWAARPITDWGVLLDEDLRHVSGGAKAPEQLP